MNDFMVEGSGWDKSLDIIIKIKKIINTEIDDEKLKTELIEEISKKVKPRIYNGIAFSYAYETKNYRALEDAYFYTVELEVELSELLKFITNKTPDNPNGHKLLDIIDELEKIRFFMKDEKNEINKYLIPKEEAETVKEFTEQELNKLKEENEEDRQKFKDTTDAQEKKIQEQLDDIKNLKEEIKTMRDETEKTQADIIRQQREVSKQQADYNKLNKEMKTQQDKLADHDKNMLTIMGILLAVFALIGMNISFLPEIPKYFNGWQMLIFAVLLNMILVTSITVMFVLIKYLTKDGGIKGAEND